MSIENRVNTFNRQNHRNISWVRVLSNSFGRGYEIHGTIGSHDFYGYSLSAATKRYNAMCKGATAK